MAFSTYMFIGFIVTAIRVISSSFISSVICNKWNKGGLARKIGVIIAMLVCVMIWPIIIINVVIGIFLRN